MKNHPSEPTILVPSQARFMRSPPGLACAALALASLGLAPVYAQQSPPADTDTTQRAITVQPAPAQAPDPAPMVAGVQEQPGILTPRGKFQLEPSLQYSYSSSNRVTLVGYTIIPALLIGLVDVREVKRNTTTAALTARYGLTPRFELEARLPYVYRSDSTVSREVGGASVSDTSYERSGEDMGDVELAARYQLNQGGGDWPYLVGSLRFKARTGKDPFEVITDCDTSCASSTGTTGLPLELPTGSGFYSLQPGVTWLFPSDPAVFFGGLSYTHNFKRKNVTRLILGGVQDPVGDVAPGGVLGINFGMGLALNEKTSFSLGVDLSSIGRTKVNGVALPDSVRTQLASLLLGYSYRVSNKTSLSVTVSAGITRDTPDLTINVRLPLSY